MYIAHKAKSHIYIDKAMVDYDSAIRRKVEEYGLEEFEKGNHDCVMDHFTVENTRQAQEARRAASGGGGRGGGSSRHPPRSTQTHSYGSGRRACKAYNFSKDGCKDENCKDAHKCSKCGKPGHKESACWSTTDKKE